MIYVYKRQDYTLIETFTAYNPLIWSIHRSQTYQLRELGDFIDPLKAPLDFADIGWRFVYWKHSLLKLIFSAMREPPLKGIERQAFEKGLDLIELHQGDFLVPSQQIPVTPDLDIENLKKGWCEAYCEFQEYILTESPTDDLEGGVQ